MVTEVQAYKAADGSLHNDRFAALRHDALEELKALGIFNHASALAIIEQAERIVAVLKPLVEEA